MHLNLHLPAPKQRRNLHRAFHRLPVCAAVAAVLGATLTQPTLAQIPSNPPVWNGSVSGNWSASGNWSRGNSTVYCGVSPNGVPCNQPFNGDQIHFAGTRGLAATNDLPFLSFHSITFDANAGAFTLSGNQFGLTNGITNNSSNYQNFFGNITVYGSQTWNGGSARMGVVGSVDWFPGELRLINSNWLNSGQPIGNRAGTTTLKLDNSSYFGTGNVSIASGSQTVALVYVNDAQSDFSTGAQMTVGDGGAAYLLLQNGGKSSAATIDIGKSDGSGYITVSGAGSRIRASGAITARQGDITVSGGGRIEGGSAVIADTATTLNPGATLSLYDAGTSAAFTGTLAVGMNGSSPTGATFGTGTVYIGTGSTLNAGNLVIGAGGTVTLDGGSLTIGQASNAGHFLWNAGTLSYTGSMSLGRGTLLGPSLGLTEGSSLLVSDTLNVAAQTSLTMLGGTLQAKGLNIAQSGSVSVDSFSTLSIGAGGVQNYGVLTLTGGTLTSGDDKNIDNFGYFTGSGTVNAAQRSFYNRGVVAQTGLLQVRAVNLYNQGSWSVSSGQTLALVETKLWNDGSLSLDNAAINRNAGDTVSTFVNTTSGTLTGSGQINLPWSNDGRMVLDGGAMSANAGLVNTGQILMTAATSVLNGIGAVSNSGRIEGLGQIGNALTNSGYIAAKGGTLTVSGSFASNAGILYAARDSTLFVKQGLGSNSGNIQLAGGTFDNNGRAMTNEVAGTVSGFGDLRGGLLTNKGNVQFSGGTSAVYANVLGTGASKIVLSGNSNTTFYGTVDIQSGATLRVAAGSAATFFAPVSQRNGALFTGTGAKYYEAGLSVGNSPGLGSDEGDVTLGDENTYLAEIGGTAPGTQFDKYIVGGLLTFGGTLKLTSWDGFVGQAGQRFDLFDWGTSAGTFAAIDATDFKLADGTVIDLSGLYTTGEIGVQAVPEPSTWAMFAIGLAGFGLASQRRRRNVLTWANSTALLSRRP